MRVILVVLGVIVGLMGVVFMLQGYGVIGGSAMSGSLLWAVLGPVIIVVGIALVVFGLRKRPER
ncbi:hypothetical protein [Agromyces sp. Marseille-Q5079]|uniref:hypothetical protein n=1 Tax=Agromyces sp. Marseille-Q5079 TaxID=3439059 RepID=UPI003D9C98BF